MLAWLFFVFYNYKPDTSIIILVITHLFYKNFFIAFKFNVIALDSFKISSTSNLIINMTQVVFSKFRYTIPDLNIIVIAKKNLLLIEKKLHCLLPNFFCLFISWFSQKYFFKAHASAFSWLKELGNSLETKVYIIWVHLVHYKVFDQDIGLWRSRKNPRLRKRIKDLKSE